MDKNYENRPTCNEILKKTIVVNKMKDLGLNKYIKINDNNVKITLLKS